MGVSVMIVYMGVSVVIIAVARLDNSVVRRSGSLKDVSLKRRNETRADILVLIVRTNEGIDPYILTLDLFVLTHVHRLQIVDFNLVGLIMGPQER